VLRRFSFFLFFFKTSSSSRESKREKNGGGGGRIYDAEEHVFSTTGSGNFVLGTTSTISLRLDFEI
ncbi:unnamed protein product, partial [Arabidopsis halleri]